MIKYIKSPFPLGFFLPPDRISFLFRKKADKGAPTKNGERNEHSFLPPPSFCVRRINFTAHTERREGQSL